MLPAGLAATARCPGGYGIRPYAVGVDACIASEPRRLPHVAFLGPLCEGAPPAGGGGENPAAIRNFTGYGKVLSLRPCGATSLAEGGRGGALPRKRPIPGHPRAGHIRPYCAF